MPNSLKRTSSRLAAVFVAAIALSLMNGGGAYACDETSFNATDVDATGLGLHGYDPVACFTAGKPKIGPKVFYAMGASLSKKFDDDPNYWKIVSGKLYVNVNGDVNKHRKEDVPNNMNNISKANQNWPETKGKTPKELL